MSERSVRRMRRNAITLISAAASRAELLESRLLLSSYTVTSAADSGPGSLRDAITNSSADTITFGVRGTIPLNSQLEISRSLTISGPGASALSISGQNRTRLFQIDAGAVVEIDGLTLTGGHSADGVSDPATSNGTAGANGGAILNAGHLSLANDTITANSAGNGGNGIQTSKPDSGGPGGNGGAIYNTGDVVLTSDTLAGNTAGAGGSGISGTVNLVNFPANPGAGGSGGAVYNTGTIVFSGGAAIGNTAGSGADGISYAAEFGTAGASGGDGGAFFNSGTLHLINVTVNGNTAGAGGQGGHGNGAFGMGGSGASGGAGGAGGGICSALGQLTLSACTLSDNAGGAGGSGGFGGPRASGGVGGNGGDGGGIACLPDTGASAVTVTNNTITGNRGGNGATGGEGGIPQVWNGQGGPGGDGGSGGSGAGISWNNGGALTLTSDTVVANTPGAGGAGGLADGPWGRNGPAGIGPAIFSPTSPAPGDITLYNTICDQIDGTLDAHLASGQQPSSYNLIGAGGSGGLTNGTNGNIVGVTDLKLGSLANNGGPTQTVALLSGSPAIDHGSNALASAAGLTTDQRGFGRVYNRIVDIGAFELGSSLPGDLNHDGSVNFSDLLALAQAYGSTNASWEQGDLNGDGSVNFADLLLLAQNYGKSSQTTAAVSTVVSSARRRAAR